MAELHFEDIREGMSFAGGTPITIEREMALEFARTFDPQPFHLSDEGGKNSLFGELVVSGWLTASLTMKLLVGGELRMSGGLIGTGGELSWKSPVRPGDTLRLEGKILGTKISTRDPARGYVKIETTTLNQLNQTVQSMVATILVMRRADSA